MLSKIFISEKLIFCLVAIQAL